MENLYSIYIYHLLQIQIRILFWFKVQMFQITNIMFQKDIILKKKRKLMKLPVTSS